MLGKILKYEIKLSIKEIGIISLIPIIASLICPFLIKTGNFLAVSFGILFYLIVFFVAVVMVVVMLYRIFYKSMFDNEGYLTNIIPAKTSSIILGKFLAMIVLAIIIYIALLISLVFFFAILNGFNETLEFIKWTASIIFEMEVGSYLTIINIFSMFFFSLVNSAAIFFFASTIFNTLKVRKYKFIIIAVIYVILSQAINTISQLPLLIVIGQTSMLNSISSVNILFGIMSGIYIVVTILILFLTIKLVDKKVDIQ